MRQHRSLVSISLLITVLLITGCANREQRIRQSAASRNLGEAYLKESKPTQALRELFNAEQLNPDDPFIQNDLGLVYRQLKQYDLSRERFQKAIDMKPDYADARNNLATIYLIQKKWDQAIAELSELTENLLYATPHYAMVNLGFAYYKKKDYPSALKHYTMAVKHYDDGFPVDATYIRALGGLGRTHIATGNANDALKALKRAELKAPTVPQLQYDLGRAHMLAKQPSAARRAFLRVMELAPDTPLAQKAGELTQLIDTTN